MERQRSAVARAEAGNLPQATARAILVSVPLWALIAGAAWVIHAAV